jgi:hypothetical protein
MAGPFMTDAPTARHVDCAAESDCAYYTLMQPIPSPDPDDPPIHLASFSLKPPHTKVAMDSRVMQNFRRRVNSIFCIENRG